MAFHEMEYDEESFLDEYSPLCEQKEEEIKTKKLFAIRRRCSSDVPMASLSRYSWLQRNIRRRKVMEKRKEKIEDLTFPVLREEDEKYKRDSGYISICPDSESVLFISDREEDEGTEDDYEPFIKNEKVLDNSLHKKASELVKKTNHFLYRQNLKLYKSKTNEKHKEGMDISHNLRHHSESQSKVGETSYQDEGHSLKTRSKSLMWKKAKKRASVFVRYICKDSKHEDETSLLQENNDDGDDSVFIPTYETSLSNTSLNDENLDSDNSNITKSDVIKFPALKNVKLKDVSHSCPTVRHRSTSLVSHISQHKTKGDDFVFKCLDEGRSIESIPDVEIVKKTVLNEEDGEPYNVITNNLFERFDIDINDDADPIDVMMRKSYECEDHINSKLREHEFSNIVEQEFDKYINSCPIDAKNIIFSASSSLSYSVNNLYDLLNKETTFTFNDC